LHDRLGLTMLYVTHDQVEAMALGDRLAIMQDGLLRQVGPPLDLYQRPTDLFVAGFLGFPPMNLWKGELRPREDQVWFHSLDGAEESTIAFPVPRDCSPPMETTSGGKVIFGFRAEGIRQLEAGQTDSAAEAVIEAQVETVERLGAETHLGLVAGGVTFVARAGPHCQARAGEMQRLAIDLAKAHWFDPVLGKTIR
jgi:multiple sugar transport system ATP-binding protein